MDWNLNWLFLCENEPVEKVQECYASFWMPHFGGFPGMHMWNHAPAASHLYWEESWDLSGGTGKCREKNVEYPALPAVSWLA